MFRLSETRFFRARLAPSKVCQGFAQGQRQVCLTLLMATIDTCVKDNMLNVCNNTTKKTQYEQPQQRGVKSVLRETWRTSAAWRQERRRKNVIIPPPPTPPPFHTNITYKRACCELHEERQQWHKYMQHERLKKRVRLWARKTIRWHKLAMVDIHIYIYIYIYMTIYDYIYIYLCVYMYIYIYTCSLVHYVCVYIYIYW